MPPANSVILSKVEALEERFSKTEENQSKVNELVAMQGAYQETIFNQLARVETSMGEQVKNAFNGVVEKIDQLATTVNGVVVIVNEHQTKFAIIEEDKKHSEKWKGWARGIAASFIAASLIGISGWLLHLFGHSVE